ncbi:uncharacterized protein DS421_16g544080 [Arachis hypogaea]|nr:uncharacterized protein DS421_16g544080 [Arachis hypogaea]
MKKPSFPSSTAPCQGHRSIRRAPHPSEENVVTSESAAVFLLFHRHRQPLPSSNSLSLIFVILIMIALL